MHSLQVPRSQAIYVRVSDPLMHPAATQYSNKQTAIKQQTHTYFCMSAGSSAHKPAPQTHP
jgi:hypothetical protein